MPEAAILESGRSLHLRSGAGDARFHAVWLRDNAWDRETRSPQNGQRLIALRDIPPETLIAAARICGNRLRVTFVPEDKTLDYDINWLLRHAYDRAAPVAAGWTAAAIETWDRSSMPVLPSADFDAVHAAPSALRDWLEILVRYGVGRLGNGPATDRALLKVVDLFGHVRETNYGRHFEVRVEVNPTNLASTGLGLQAHTDNPYRDPAPSVLVL